MRVNFKLPFRYNYMFKLTFVYLCVYSFIMLISCSRDNNEIEKSLTYFDATDGRIKIRSTDDRVNGMLIERFEQDSSLRYSAECVDGHIQGLETEFHPNGTLKIKRHYSVLNNKSNMDSSFEYFPNRDPKEFNYPLINRKVLYELNGSRKEVLNGSVSYFDIQGEEIKQGIESFNIPTVNINGQIWTKENLRVTKLRNGEPLFLAKSLEDWIWAELKKVPAYCYRNFAKIDADFGLIYNIHAINTNLLIPNGFRLPSNADIDDLMEYSGAYQHLLRSDWGITTSSGFQSLGDNKSGFNASPLGFIRTIEPLGDEEGTLRAVWVPSLMAIYLNDGEIYTLDMASEYWRMTETKNQSRVNGYYIYEDNKKSNFNGFSQSEYAAGIRLIKG